MAWRDGTGQDEFLAKAWLRLAFDNGITAPQQRTTANAMSIDSTLFLALNGSATSPHWLTALAVFSTKHLPQLVAAGAAGVFMAGSRQVKRGVLQALAAMAMAFVLAHLGQYLIARDRPFVVGLGTQWLPHRASHSLPSAHASVSFAFACAVAMVLAAGYRLWAIAALAVAVLISWSRVYLGLHFPSDIVAGVLLGAASGWLACRWPLSKLLHLPRLAPLHLTAAPAAPLGSASPAGPFTAP